MFYVPESFYVLTLEDNVEFTVMNENAEDMITIVVPKPSIVTRIGSGYTLSDFTVVPIGGSTTTITVDDADAFDFNKSGGYSVGSIVSYVNASAPEPFNTLSVYVADVEIPYIGVFPDGYVESPEENASWIWQGEEIAIPSGTGSTVFVTSTTSLQQIVGYKSGDTVSVMNGNTYRYQYVNSFDPLYDLYPFDQVGNPNYCWTYRFYSNDLGIRPKINYSGLREAVYGDDHDGAGVTLEMGECIVLLDSTSSVQVNGTTFLNQSPCVIYNRLNGTGLEVIEFGGGGSTIISKTYAELQSLVASNGLVQGQQYLLSDYRTKHVIPNSSPVELNTGVLEPLILTATSTNKFHVEVKSTTFPTDIIHYRFDDDSCEDGTRDSVNKKWAGGTIRTGYISYRKSTNNNLSTYYDWRNYKVRRWKLDAIEWVSATLYLQREVVKSPSDGNIYICTKDTTIDEITDPNAEYTHWSKWMDLSLQTSANAYLAFTHDISKLNFGNANPSNLIVANSVAGADYEDFYTFCILTEPNNSSGIIADSIGGAIIGEGFKDFEIGKFDYEFSNWWGNVTDALESNVFYLFPNGDAECACYSNIIGGGSTCNTINSNNFYSNCINDLLQCNTIGDNFYSNTIGYDFYSNTIGYNFYYNTIGNIFYSNTIGNDFSCNTIGNYFYYNTIGDNFYSNTTGNYFYYNTIGNYFYSNTIVIPVQNIDWLNFVPTPVHVSASYNTTIFKNSAGVNRLSYYDANDQLIITDITA